MLEKLKSNAGVSILFALMALLLAIMVSAVLINAALTNTKRVSRTIEQNQEYLTIESAVLMLREMVGECVITFDMTEEVTTRRTVGEGGTENVQSEWIPSVSNPAVEIGGVAMSESETGGSETDPAAPALNPFQDAFYTAVQNSGVAGGGEPVQLLISVTTEEAGVKPQKKVKVTFAPDFLLNVDTDGPDLSASSFDFVITASLVEEDGSTAAQYENKMRLQGAGSCAETGSDVLEGEFSITQYVENPDPETRAGIPVAEARVDKVIHHYRISWENLLITKDTAGAAGGGT